jgi:signal transduction histidine kinase
MAKNNQVQFLSKNQEIIYNIVLIILIPATLIINSFLFTVQFKKTIDQSLYLKATAISEVLNATMLDRFEDDTALRSMVKNVASFNNDVRALDILRLDKESGQFKVVASLDDAKVGQASKATNYFLAWNKNWPVAMLSSQASGSNQTPERVWVIASPLRDEVGAPQVLLSLSVSLKLMDEFTKPVLLKSVIILVVTVGVVLLLLFGNARLFEYAILYNKIKELDQMKDEFISMASHELRTPITVIDGYATLMLEDTSGQIVINDLARENLQLIKGSTARLKALIEDLLNVSRIEQGRLKAELLDCDLDPIIKSVVKELSNSAIEKKLQLSYQAPTKKLPLIKLDSDRMKQVLINLIGNAIKYTPSGSVTISTQLDQQAKYLELRIKDTGIGMSAKDRERLFEKFYRVQNDKTSAISGTGLGLWITKQIVEMMKGEISVDSIENVGTQVALRFPLIK